MAVLDVSNTIEAFKMWIFGWRRKTRRVRKEKEIKENESSEKKKLKRAREV